METKDIWLKDLFKKYGLKAEKKGSNGIAYCVKNWDIIKKEYGDYWFYPDPEEEQMLLSIAKLIKQLDDIKHKPKIIIQVPPFNDTIILDDYFIVHEFKAFLNSVLTYLSCDSSHKTIRNDELESGDSRFNKWKEGHGKHKWNFTKPYSSEELQDIIEALQNNIKKGKILRGRKQEGQRIPINNGLIAKELKRVIEDNHSYISENDKWMLIWDILEHFGLTKGVKLADDVKDGYKSRKTIHLNQWIDAYERAIENVGSLKNQIAD